MIQREESDEFNALLKRVRAIKENKGSIAVPADDLRDIIDMADRLTSLNISALNYREGKGIDAELKPPVWFHAMLVCHLAAMLTDSTGKVAANYVSQAAYHKDFGELYVIIQRKNKKTPTMLIAEAEQHIRDLLKMNPNPNHSSAIAAQAFLDRPRSEEPPTDPLEEFQ